MISNYVEEIKTKGFCLLPDVLTKEECEQYKALLERDYLAYHTKYINSNTQTQHGLDSKKNEKVVFNLHNKDIAWLSLFDHPTIIEILDVTLKDGSYKNQEPYNLLNISARTPLKNSGDQQLHLDSNLPGGDYPLIMVVLWMLDDFSKESGATRVVPGSHRFKDYAEDGKEYSEEITVEGKQGTVLIYNASLWHGGGKNFTDSTRWGLVLGYGRWFIKPSFDFVRNTPQHIFDQMNDFQKELLGFKSTPPKDEFTRLRRRSEQFENPAPYQLP